MPALTITVLGTPAPQGSKRFVGIKNGRGMLVESSKLVKPWRQDVTVAAREAVRRAGGMIAICGPAAVEIVFTLPKPKSAPKRRQTFPDRKPDIDKLCRSTLDAIVAAGAIVDDACVVRLTAAKVYPGEGVDALDVPGAVIRVRQIIPPMAAGVRP